jgi:hypothetical protein
MKFRISLLMAAILLNGITANAGKLKPFQATCPNTAFMGSQGVWSSGVRFEFDRAEIYIWKGIPQHLRCWYKNEHLGSSAFLSSFNEVRNGYECAVVNNNTFNCK